MQAPTDPLDIVHPFDLGCTPYRTDVLPLRPRKGAVADMAMVRISPLEVHVRTDWFDGRPRSIRIAQATVPVVAVEAVREESAAYPAATGPRTLFPVLTPPYPLPCEHGRRRWFVEALAPDVSARPAAA